MDPITHTLAGAALAASGWRRRTALAVPAAIIAANIPDVDIITMTQGEYASLALRRGWTHGPPAIMAGALVVLLLVLAWDRLLRRRRAPDAQPVRAGPLLLLVLIAAVSHPVLDWMNTYGVRWLMPFDRTWFYGDSLFIIDPWLWLLLGVPLFLLYSASRRALVAWAALAVLLSLLVLGTGMVPIGAKVLWLAAIAAAAVLRMRARPRTAADEERLGWSAVAAGAVYIILMIASSAAAARVVESYVAERGVTVQRTMIGPRPANPLRAQVIIDDGAGYLLGDFAWLRRPHASIRPIPIRREMDNEVVAAAAVVPRARDFLVWSRFPLAETERSGDGWVVRFRDARYLTGPGSGTLGGVTVRLDSGLQRVD